MNAVAVPTPITQCVITKPAYVAAPDYGTWLRLNQPACLDYWEQLDDGDAERPGQISEFLAFAKSQYDVFCATAEEEEDEEAPPRLFRSTDEAAAHEAGVRARGEI